MKKKDLFCSGNTRKLTYAGVEYDFIPGTLDSEIKEFPENIVEQTNLTIRIWKADFSTLPGKGDKVTISGENKRILGTHEDNLGLTIKFALGAEYART